MRGRIGCVFLVSLSVVAFTPAQRPGPGEDGGSVKRQEQLIQALKRGTYFDVLRAAEELAVMDKLDPLVTRDLLAVIRQRPDGNLAFDSVRFVDALAAAGPGGVPVILRAIRTGDEKGER